MKRARVFITVAMGAVAQLSAPAAAQSSSLGGKSNVNDTAANPSLADAARPWAGIGRAATPAEIAAWDIDVRADFTGLPPGSGSVDEGMEIWDAQCASCHGTFGESNEVFTPIVGGTTQEDIRTGRVANLLRADFPQRTTLMKLSQLSTLWDYINRAMPWNAPKSLSVDEVYAVTAYILNLGDIVPADFVLSHENVAEVQQRLPNRNGKKFFEPMWSVAGKPDVQGDACM
nr:cytochrome c [Burkholderiaceae bacterium]